VAPLFSSFEELEPKRYSLSDVFSQLMSGQMQLHISHDGEKFHFAMLTQLVPYPKCNVCVVYFACGVDAKKAFPLFKYLVEWARRRDVEEFELIGRPGWEKVLAPLGFSKHSIVMYKRIV
jgi:hypothetical protein